MELQNITPVVETPLIETRKCTVCGKDKPLDEYHASCKTKCKKCYSAYYNKKIKESRIKIVDNDGIEYFNQKVAELRGNAKYRNIFFDLTAEELLAIYKKQNKVCAYTKQKFDDTNKRTALSVDRIDPKKPYTKKNVKLCLNCINTMKSDMPMDDLIFFAKKLLETLEN